MLKPVFALPTQMEPNKELIAEYGSRATATTKITCFPPILLISLKRFNNTKHKHCILTKIHDFMETTLAKTFLYRIQNQ